MTKMLQSKEIAIQTCMHSVLTQNKLLACRNSKEAMLIFKYTKYVMEKILVDVGGGEDM